MSLQQRWADALIDAFAAAGVRDVVISPGSRSTPLVLAALGHGALRCHDVIDERSAAFFALGQARATRRPSLLVCTSGSAPANYLPAVIEASQAHVPVVVLSSDRPHELHHCGANQTVDQTKLFGDHVRLFLDFGPARPDHGALRGLRRAAVQCVARASWPTPGPAHLNFRTVKPLEPAPDDDAAPAIPERVTRLHPPRAQPSADAIDEVARACAASTRGIIVCGPADVTQAEHREHVAALARASGFLLFAEATSQLRFAPSEVPHAGACDAFDVIFQSSRARARWRPELVLQLGAAPVSSALDRMFAEDDVRRFVLAEHGWPDPHGNALAVVQAPVGDAARALAARLEALRAGDPPRADEWHEALAMANANVWKAADALLAEHGDELREGRVAREVVGALDAGSLLLVGNSLAVRQLDRWCPASSADGIRVISQRGASGIEGLLSGAAGAASTREAPTALLVGDVSFLHDLGGLATARAARAPLVIVVVNNDGGRIFDQLPLGRRDDLAAAMRHFTTPHGLALAGFGETFGVAHARVRTASALRAQLATALSTPACTLIEALVSPHAAKEDDQRLTREAERAVEALGAHGRAGPE